MRDNPMDPNDKPSDPFPSQPLFGPVKMHVCKDGRCVLLVQGGDITPESRKAVERFVRDHRPEKGDA